MKVRRLDGETPNGGVRSEMRFFDKNRKPVDESKAMLIEVVEFDKDDSMIANTWMSKLTNLPIKGAV